MLIDQYKFLILNSLVLKRGHLVEALNSEFDGGIDMPNFRQAIEDKMDIENVANLVRQSECVEW